jgi:hypothetical protein
MFFPLFLESFLRKRRGMGNRTPYPELLHRRYDDDDDGAIDKKEFIVSLIFGRSNPGTTFITARSSDRRKKTVGRHSTGYVCNISSSALSTSHRRISMAVMSGSTNSNHSESFLHGPHHFAEKSSKMKSREDEMVFN